MSEFKPGDPEVRDIAAIFALKGWTWTSRDAARAVYVPKPRHIADELNRLLAGAQSNGAGNQHCGRLFVSIDVDVPSGFDFGIEWYGRDE